MPRTPTVDFECPTCHHKFGDVTKLRRHTMAMYGCWPRLNENSTRYRLAIPSDTERAWYEDRVMREREARSGQRDVNPARGKTVGSSGGSGGGKRPMSASRERSPPPKSGRSSTERGRERTPPRRPAALVLELSPPQGAFLRDLFGTPPPLIVVTSSAPLQPLSLSCLASTATTPTCLHSSYGQKKKDGTFEDLPKLERHKPMESTKFTKSLSSSTSTAVQTTAAAYLSI